MNCHKTTRISIVSVFVVICVLSFPLLGLSACNCILLGPNPPMPEIRYGEFPFRLEYEINGERVVVEDTVICEFDGIGLDTASWKYRKWKKYLASNSNEMNVLIVIDEKIKIYCYVGSAEYYMGDEKWPELKPLTSRFVHIKKSPNDMNVYEIDEFIEKYNLKLISWEFTDPIVNTFK